MRPYLKLLSILYYSGGILHLLDLLNLRLEFSKMNPTWKVWTIFLLISDCVVATGLWNKKLFGIYGFLTIATSQILIYSFFKDTFGDQSFLIIFHVLTLVTFFALKAHKGLTKTKSS